MFKPNYQLHFFGCSFTDMTDSLTGYEFSNFREIIKTNTNHECYNHSKTGNSNAGIIDDVYFFMQSDFNKYKNHPEKIFIIQTTFLYRLGLYSDIENKFISISKTDKNSSDDYREHIAISFYNDWIKYFYNSKNELYEFQKKIDMLCAYLKSYNIKFILIGMDEHLDLIQIENKFDTNGNSFFQRNNFISFYKNNKPYYSLYGYAIENKLRISDVVNNPENIDYHFNQEGHNLLNETILKKIDIY